MADDVPGSTVDDEPFEQMEVDQLDMTVGNGSHPELETASGEAVVPKQSYCERCEHFAEPPEAACTNPATEIRQLVDMDHFLVANCPVVERRWSLGRTTED